MRISQFLTLTIIACTPPPPKVVPTGDGVRGFKLNYYVDSNEVYAEAERACPRGYRTLQWDGDRPEVIVCQDSAELFDGVED